MPSDGKLLAGFPLTLRCDGQKNRSLVPIKVSRSLTHRQRDEHGWRGLVGAPDETQQGR